MEALALLVIHILTTLAQRAGPGGTRAIFAESVLLKHQPLIALPEKRPNQALQTDSFAAFSLYSCVLEASVKPPWFLNPPLSQSFVVLY